MIRCPSCKMLNRVGSIHCGFCGELLTGKATGKDDPGFKAPKLTSGDSGEEDEHDSGEAGPVGPTRAPASARRTMFGMPAEPSADPPLATSQTVIGMPAVKLDESGRPMGVAEARAAADRQRARAAESEAAAGPSGPSAQVVVSGETDALADTPPPEPAVELVRSGPYAGVRRKPPSKTLFGMRAAELHLGLAESDSVDEPTLPRPRLKEAFPTLSDTAEHRAVVDDEGNVTPAPGGFSRRTSSSRIEAVAPLRGTGAAFADTAVIRAVDPDEPQMRDAIARAQARSSVPGAPAAPTPPVEPPSAPEPPPIPAGAAAAPQAQAPPAPESPSLWSVEGAARPAPRWTQWMRSAQLIGGASLLAASFLPWASSVWRQTDVWTGLGPALLGAVGLALVAARHVPKALLVLLGLLAVTVGAVQVIEGGLPGAGPGAIVRFGLVVTGAVLLGVVGVGALRGAPQPPPDAPG